MNKYLLHDIGISLILCTFIILSLKIPNNTIISYVDENAEIHYSHEFMSGGEDDIPFIIAFIVFIPVTILSIINIFRTKKIKTLYVFIIAILVQIFLIRIWLDYGNILLNFMYGTIIIKIWIVLFTFIIMYTIMNILKTVKNKYYKK